MAIAFYSALRFCYNAPIGNAPFYKVTMIPNSPFTDLTASDKSMLRISTRTPWYGGKAKQSSDANFMYSLTSAAETDESANVRTGSAAHILIRKVVGGDLQKSFADHRNDLIDADLYKMVLRRTGEEPAVPARREIAKTLQILSEVTPVNLIDDKMYSSHFHLAANEQDPETRLQLYGARMNILPRAPERLTPDLVATLVQPVPPRYAGLTRPWWNRVVYATRAPRSRPCSRNS